MADEVFVAIYKVVRLFRHKTHGWIKWGRFVRCRPIFAKNYVIRHELVRCKGKAGKQDSVLKTALWIDSIEDPLKNKK